MEDRLVNLVRRRMDFTIRTTDSGVRQCFAPTPFNSRFRSHALITHGTLQKAELFCEIRMVHGIAVANRRKCDGRDARRIQDALVDKVPGLENNVPQGGVVWVFAVKK
jgi:hypothetical protein